MRMSVLFRPNQCLNVNMRSEPLLGPVAEQTPLFHARRFSCWGRKAKRRPRLPYHRETPFFKDVILLFSPRDKKVPRKKVKALLHEKGHIISALQLDKTWDNRTLLLKPHEAFDGRIPSDVRQPKERVPISEILGELGDQIDNTQVCKFNINLSAVLDGALRGFRRLSYDPKKKTFIKFSDDRGTTEEAVDLGGPRREFLRLLIKALADSDMFSGPEGNLNLALSASAVRDDRYFIAGRAIAVSLVHGGPPPCFLSRTLFTCLTEGPDACCPVLEDITDIDLYSKLKKISEAKTLKELQQFAEPLTDYLANAGCLRPLTSLADKDKLVEDVLMFQVVQRVRGPLERFSDGLKTLGVLKKIKLHPEAFRPVMCYSPGTLTAEIMEELFDIRWSEVGSNNRADENRVVAYWRDYLQDAEEEEGPAKLGDILAFAAGCHVAPPIGFCPEPSLECQRGRYPIANTCINCLKIPLPKSYDDFKRNMDFAIQNTQGFGME
ncbi:G2/M phase-specific E3 ubiquitin-protein ligase-like isoform X4 [Epinephelus fuscoguttatus]|uniref:G2/M phase-specific E3 ubiquitin-protein ligase-like isoform X4 n=1 Tax=Epinephelus fuscoguttatus TaxID=293821 RepID=UPI0020D0AEED|nr:G2/M phase-specific E3 ubiquitin-protein ligase-like isoform X4 [Epinephelus fuscoguttatus]